MRLKRRGVDKHAAGAQNSEPLNQMVFMCQGFASGGGKEGLEVPVVLLGQAESLRSQEARRRMKEGQFAPRGGFYTSGVLGPRSG